MCASSQSQGLLYLEQTTYMETIGKLYRYLAIREAYNAVLAEAGKYAKNLSRTSIYEETQKYLLAHNRQEADIRTIQRALKSPMLTEQQIELRR